MSIELLPIAEQVVVITGASSGIGLATAELACQRGARVVLAARSENTLNEVAKRLRQAGGEAIAIPCDVTDREQVSCLATTAIERFGRIHTWVNNAGVSVYGRLTETDESDDRRLFDVNFWGVVNGSLVAMPYLREGGGALINLGSEVSDAVIPLLGMYSASKHAVKGFTDALRIEIEELDDSRVSITLIQPTAVDTPFPQHARNYMEHEPRLPRPRIEPKDVAEAILDAAEHPTRSKKVGVMASVNTMLAKLAPGIADKMSAKQSAQLHYDESPRNPQGTLYCPGEAIGTAGQVHGSGGIERK